MDEEEEEGREVPVVWAGVEELPVLFVNQFVSQVDKGEVYLTIGQMQPPALLGTPDERREQLENLSFVAVKPVARLAMTPSRLRELASLLEITAGKADKQNERYGDPREHS